jgi:type IV secretory pathway VirB4 component
MNGARGIPETLAQKRFFFSSLPGLGETNKREKDVLTLHAADLLPVEMPWKGTPNSPLMLFETPYRQLIPFSPFDSGLGDANMLIMAKSNPRVADSSIWRTFRLTAASRISFG